MKILYGITKSNFGGAQRYVFDMATAAKAAGHDVVVMCGGEGPLVERLRKEKIRTISIIGLGRDISFIEDWESFIFILKTLKKERPDIFHTNSPKMGGIGNLAGKIVGIKKIIFTGHGWDWNESKPKWHRILTKFFSWLTVLLSDVTICVSKKTENDVVNFPFIKNRLITIRNSVPHFTLLPRLEAREKLVQNISPTTLVVGTLSELHRVKALDVLLRSWKKFTEKNQGILVIVGGGEEEHRLRNMINELGVSDSVYLKGFVENGRELLSGYDIFTLPSQSEGLPYVLLEAGIAKLPVITTHVGGIPEIIESGVNGVLVAPENPEELFSSLLLLSEDPVLRRRLGEKLKETITNDFSFEKMTRDTLKLYA